MLHDIKNNLNNSFKNTFFILSLTESVVGASLLRLEEANISSHLKKNTIGDYNMARMHSRAKGKSGSKKPAVLTKPSWVTLKDKEIEMLVLKLSKENLSPSQIGLTLRDKYGIPDVKLLTGKSITTILAEKDINPDFPEDMMALIKKAVFIRKHLEDNHKDEPAKRGLILTESKIMRLGKYYKREGKISADWKYDPKKIKLLVD